MRKNSRVKKITDETITLHPDGQKLSRLGPKTEAAVNQLDKLLTDTPLLFSKRDDIYSVLHHAFRDEWSDADTATVLEKYTELISDGPSRDIHSLARWIRVHVEDPVAVTRCMSVDPPSEISIHQLLSTAGSQKLVFLATWDIAQTEVVLKSFINPDASERILERELQPHPLSMAHPNIIETHKLTNSKGEAFLVERRLQKVLDDRWTSNGVHEAANLLRDIASALAFLSDKQLIHGDIKPDNIGFDNGRYILLDFGICRPVTSFSHETTATGSLRTRSPELIMGSSSHTAASDVWALGATVFNALVKRFPLFNADEKPPKISKPDERSEFEALLAERVDKKWDKLIYDSAIPEPMRNLLSKMLSRDPSIRPSASGLLREAEQELAAFLRPTDNSDRF